MYIVTIQNGTTRTEIHNEHYKLLDGKVVKGINTIDSFSFSVLPDNPAFGNLHDFMTLVEVYNTARQRYEFYGRVLCTSPQMSESGLITQEATCESYFGFLCDSEQEYVPAQSWTARTLLAHLISVHNRQLEGEDYKHFEVGTVYAFDRTKLDALEIKPENTWDSIKKNLIDLLGGEIGFRVERNTDGSQTIYIDYLKQLGETKETEIALSRNMKSIVKEKDPSAFITRLIPLGAKKKDKDGNDTEERYDITSVNNGKNYIDDAEAIAEYGLHVGRVEFDDETDPATIKSKGQTWLKDNNKVMIKYSITALDLSRIGKDIDDFDVCNTYPVKNKLLGIDDTARVNKKTIDVCDENKTSIEIGESFKTLSELQREQMVSINKLNVNVAEIIRNYVTNQKLTSEINRTVSLIEQTDENIRIDVARDYATIDSLGNYATKEFTKASIDVAIGSINLSVYATKESLNSYATKNDLTISEQGITAEISQTYATKDSVTEINGKLELKINTADLSSELSSIADKIYLESDTLTIKSRGFTLEGGAMTATGGKIGGFSINGTSGFYRSWDVSSPVAHTNTYTIDQTGIEAKTTSATTNYNGRVKLTDGQLFIYPVNYNLSGKIVFAQVDFSAFGGSLYYIYIDTETNTVKTMFAT